MLDLSKALEKAKKADIEAMQQLIEYYEEQGDEENVVYWNMQRDKEQLVGLTIISNSVKIVSIVTALTLGFWEALEDDCLKIREDTQIVLSMYRNNEVVPNRENVSKLRSDLRTALYGLAVVAFCRDNDPQKAANFLLEFDGLYAREKLLLGLASFQLGDYSKAFHNYSDGINDRNYRTKERTTLEEGIYADAFNHLAAIYRVGIPGIVSPNLERSVEILNLGIETLKDVDYKRKMSVELSRYKKKMFGGYKYV